MNSPAGIPADPLVTLQLQVARRADELASHLEHEPISLNLLCWLKAEEEVLTCSLPPSNLPDQLTQPASPRVR